MTACHFGNVKPTLFLLLQLYTCCNHACHFDCTVPDLCLIIYISNCPSNAYHRHITTVRFIHRTSLGSSSLQHSYGRRLSMPLLIIYWTVSHDIGKRASCYTIPTLLHNRANYKIVTNQLNILPRQDNLLCYIIFSHTYFCSLPNCIGFEPLRSWCT